MSALAAEDAAEQPACRGPFNPKDTGERPVPQSSAMIRAFMAKILHQRKGSFWNRYYRQQCIWVSEQLKQTMKIVPTKAAINVVEIGTAWGGNADYIGVHFHGAHVFAVDPLAPDYDPLDGQSQKIASIAASAGNLSSAAAGGAWADALVLDAHRPGGAGCRYHLLKEFSTAAAPMLEKTLGKGGIHFLFVDGLHTYEGVVADITAYAPLVMKGGVIVFNDYGSTGFPGVTQAVDEFIAANNDLALVVGTKFKPPGFTNAGASIPLDWSPVLPWPTPTR